MDRGELQNIVDLAREISGLAFAISIGDIDSELTLTDADATVAFLVDPVNRQVRVVTGAYAVSRISDHACALAIEAFTATARQGDLLAGIRNALMLLAEHARAPQVLNRDEPD
jgi:hypothetical protein